MKGTYLELQRSSVGTFTYSLDQQRSLPSIQMSASPTPPSPDVAEEDDGGADLPLTMAASVVLEHLPKDAHKALETAGELEQAKGTLVLII